MSEEFSSPSVSMPVTVRVCEICQRPPEGHVSPHETTTALDEKGNLEVTVHEPDCALLVAQMIVEAPEVSDE